MKTKTLKPFLAITFSMTWGIAALLIFFNDQMVAIFGEISPSNPLFILAVYAPGISALFLVWKYYGLNGLGSFFQRLTLWRMPRVWWLYLVLGIPAIAYLSAGLNGTLNDPFPIPSGELIATLVAAFFLGSVEEFGWRGVAMPLLQRRKSPFWAGLTLGVIHAVWHFPAFLLGGGLQYGSWPIVPYFFGVVALSVILTPLFNSSRGSLLIAYLYHFQMMNPVWPDGQPWDNLLFGIAAVVIVFLNRKTIFQKGSGVTEILMPGHEDIRGN